MYHKFVNPQADGGDATITRPSDWNAVHVGSDPVFDMFGAPDTAFEFDTASLAGLTAIGTPDVANADTSVPGCLFIQDDTGSTAMMGYYFAAPSFPFTSVVKVLDDNTIQDFSYIHAFVGEADPTTGAFVTSGVARASNQKLFVGDKWTSRTNTGSNIYGLNAIGLGHPYYFAIVANSTSDLDLWWSTNGWVWRKSADAYNPSLTIASVGLGMSPITATGLAVAFDYIRVWNSALTIPGA